MSEAQLATLDATPALGLSFRTILDKDGRRAVVFQTHVAQSVSEAELNALLDRCCRVIDRQVAKAELVLLVPEVDRQLQALAKFEMSLEELDVVSKQRWDAAGKQAPWDPKKIPPQERTARENTQIGIGRTKEEIRRMRARIVELENLVGDNVLASSANSDPGLPDCQMPRDDLAGGAEA